MAQQLPNQSIDATVAKQMATRESEQNVILVTGATGTVGCHVVNQLVRLGQRVRALTRKPAKANLPNGVEIVTGDLAAPQTLAPLLEGVSSMHLITFSGDDYTPLQTGPEIVELAKKAGVRRVTVLWSGEGKKGSVEQAVEASELEWTILQPQEFMANALEWAEAIRTEGVVRVPFGGRLTAAIHEADIGAVAATALTKNGHAGKTYTLTGPEVLTPIEQVRAINYSHRPGHKGHRAYRRASTRMVAGAWLSR